MKKILRFVRLLQPMWGWIVLAVILKLLSGLCAVMLPVIGSYALLAFFDTHTVTHLNSCFCALVIFAVLRGAFQYGASWVTAKIAYTGMAELRNRLFAVLRQLWPSKLSGKNKGNLVSLLTSDIELLEVFYSHTFVPVLSTILYVIILAVFIGTFHPLLGGLALVAYGIVGFVIPLVSAAINRPVGGRMRSKSGALSDYMLESLRGLWETRQYGGSQARMAAMNRQTDAILQEEKRLRRNAGVARGITDAAVIFFTVCMLFAAAALYRQGAVGFAGVLISTMTLLGSFEPCIELASLGSRLTKTFGAGRRILAILDEQPTLLPVSGNPDIAFRGAKVAHVSLAMEGYPVLTDASLEIPVNTIVGLTGPSSSAKSVILRLLMRFWETTDGDVLISDTPMTQINTDNLRRMESLVAQQTYLFQDTIRNNLRIAKLDATQAEIEAACKKASVHDFIMGLPKGYDTQVGELGDRLSGGERQRIGLARAFLHEAPFLLLDEPTSNLDSINEAVILRSLHNQRREKTVLLVSHRSSALCIADEVYSVERGTVKRVR